LELQTFGIREFSHTENDVEVAVEEIRIQGLTIVPNVVANHELPAMREALDRIFQTQLEEIGGVDKLKLLQDNWTARAPLAYDERFLGLATSPAILNIVRAFLGDYFTLMLQNGVINVPARGQEQAAGAWHRDLNYQHFVSSRPLSISALVCIDDFSETTGGTLVLDGSHKLEPFPSPAYVSAHQRTINAPAGAALVFDSMLYHRGGLNRSSAPRRGVNHMYTLPLLKPQISFARLFGGKYADDPFLRNFLGYESEPAASVKDFRELRLRRLARMT
jgi:ectoine hydroxylase-related dioxygenase (phytanoyl-CoA dioxygenase family)